MLKLFFALSALAFGGLLLLSASSVDELLRLEAWSGTPPGDESVWLVRWPQPAPNAVMAYG